MENGNEKIVESKSHYRLRSSLKRTCKNPVSGLDLSDECQDVTLAPLTRRVSFAASSTVKPFVDDPEKNTIWDNTYEEEINSHADSANVVPRSVQEANGIPLADQSIGNLESKHESMAVDETNRYINNCSIYQMVDMSMTCKFTGQIINKENICPDKVIDVPSNNGGFPNLTQSTADLESTCQFTNPQVLGQHAPMARISQSASGMDFTCQFSQDPRVPTKKCPLSNISLSATDMEFTCQLPPYSFQISSQKAQMTDMSLSATDMEFTCCSPQEGPKIHISTSTSEKDQNVTQLEPDRKCAYYLPQTVESSNHTKFPNSEIYHETMATEAVATINETGEDAELACRETVESQLNNMANVSKPVKTGLITLTSLLANTSEMNGNTEFSSHIPAEAIGTKEISQIPVYLNTPPNINQTSRASVKKGAQSNKSVTTNELNSLENSEIVSKETKVEKSNCSNQNSYPGNSHLHGKTQSENVSRQVSFKVKEFGNIPIAIDSSMEQSNKDGNAIRDKTYNISHSVKENTNRTNSVVVQEQTYSVPDQQVVAQNALDIWRIKKSTKSMKDGLSEYYDENNQGKSEVAFQHAELAETKENWLCDNFEGLDRNETIVAQECSLIDTITSIPDEGLAGNGNEPVKNQKVIYSEPMIVAKPSTSILDFSGGFSSIHSSTKKNDCLNSIGSLDGTQQLIEATFSKQLQHPDTTQTSSDATRFAFLETSSINVQKIFENIQNKIILYVPPPQLDFEEYTRKIKESQDLRNKVRLYLETCQSPVLEPRRSILEDRVRKLSLANNSFSSTNNSDSLLDDSKEDEKIAEVPKTLHERIISVFSSTEEHIMKLEHHEPDYYVFSTFSQAAWFAVELHPKDGRVVDIQSLSKLKENSSSIWPNVYKFIVKHIRNKLQMNNLRSSLGSCFDMLSLLDHANLITEKCFEFCIEFMNTQRQYKTLEMDNNETVSFRILVVKPPIWWTVEFSMASLENIQQDSLTVNSKWGSVNEEHLKAILRNTEPGLDSIRKFIADVVDYVKRTQLVLKTTYQQMNKQK